MKKLLITKNKKARELSQKLHPRIIISPEDIMDLDLSLPYDVWLDGKDTNIFDNNFSNNSLLKYSETPFNFSGDIQEIRKTTKELIEYKIPSDPLPTIEDDFMESADSLPSESATPPNLEEGDVHEIPMSQQISILDPLLEGKRIGAGTIAELTAQITELCSTNQLFLRDKITGLFKSRFARKPLISEYHAQTIFETHFVDKLAIKSITYRTDKETGAALKNITYKKVSRADLDLLWRNLKIHSVFNSRKIFYDQIPEWDGEKRIDTFMKKYFECDVNPNFFLLLMTSIIGKIVAPEKNYCPYFFDIVSNSKGIGKSLLCRRLLGFKYCGFLSMTSRKDDFYVNAYDGNNIIVVDDECTWIGKGFDKLSYDEFKSMVILPSDKFSRKFAQPEEHDRCFVIMRTSNYVNQVFSTNERRQVIFQSGLKEQECRILDLPDSFFEQMLAEAKAYYNENGMYQLTPEDRLDIKDANLDNYNWETEDNFQILDYVKSVRSEPEKYGIELVAQKFSDDKWGNYKKYCEWCNAKNKRPINNRAFWRNVSALAELPEHFMVVLSEQKYELAEGGKSRVFRVDPIKKIIKNQDEIPDLPY